MKNLTKPQRRFLAALFIAQTRPEKNDGWKSDRNPVEYFVWQSLTLFTGGVTPQLPTLRKLQSYGLIETNSEDIVQSCECRQCRCRSDAWRLTPNGFAAVSSWNIKIPERFIRLLSSDDDFT